MPLCDALGIHPRTYARWKADPVDRRKGSRKQNNRALTEKERLQIIEVCTSDRFKDITPGEIVAILAEEGIYLASERTFYRVLKDAGMLHHRTNSRPSRRPYQPPELKATGPDQVYTWDITWLPSYVSGIFWFCYAVIDVWNREIIGWTIQGSESEEHARRLFESISQRRNLKGVWVHSDNGNPMRGATFSVWLATLGMFLSHSRPLVKNDNPYIESFFRTLKYHAAYPGRFRNMDEARTWMGDFIDWYNTTHRHSGLGYITPEQRRLGEDIKLFERRNETLQKAFDRHPERFPKSGPKQWKSRRVVYLNPSHETKHLIHRKVA
jgi:transposase InsO family protein